MLKKSIFQTEALEQRANTQRIFTENSLSRRRVHIPQADPLDRAQFTSRLVYNLVKDQRKLYDFHLKKLTQLSADSVALSDQRWLEAFSNIITLLEGNHIFNDPADNEQILAEIYSGLAHHLKNIGDYPAALTKFERSLQIDRQNVKALNGLGLLYEKLNQNDKAINTYQRALEFDPNYDTALINYAVLCTKLFAQTNNFNFVEKSKNLLDRAEFLKPNTPIVLRNKAFLYQKLHQFDLAAYCLQKVLKLEPGDSKSYFGLADNAFLRGDFKEAKRFYIEALAIAQRDPEKAAIYINLSCICIYLKDYVTAKEYANNALSCNLSNKLWAYLNLLTADLNNHDYWSAYDMIDSALIKFPYSEYNPYFYCVIGDILSHFGYFDEAILAYLKASSVESDPLRKGNILFCLGNVQYDQGKYQEALKTYQHTQQNNNFNQEFLSNAITDTQTVLSNPQLALPPIPRSKINIESAQSYLKPFILRQYLPTHFATTHANKLPSNGIIEDNKLFYTQNLGEFKMHYTSFFLEKKSDDNKWYKKSRHKEAQNWRLANSPCLHNFVILFDEKYRRHVIVCGHTRHYYLARETDEPTFGIPVRYAGGVLFKNGEIIHWNNRSGHYRPLSEQAAKEIGVIIGFPLDKFVSQENMTARIKKLLQSFYTLDCRYIAKYKLEDLAQGNKKTVCSLIKEFRH